MASSPAVVQDATRLCEDFDRIALLSPERSENDRYQDWLLRFVPRYCADALDIGCGTGSLSRALASRAAHVLALDLSPKMVEVARQRSLGHPNIQYAVGDFLSMQLPVEHFDCVTAVAVLHHLSWTAAVQRAKALLRPGGVLLILDLLKNDGPGDLALGGVAWILRALGNIKTRPSAELRRAWAEHGRGDSYLTLSETRRLCHETLPGASLRRHLFWRYSVVWSK